MREKLNDVFKFVVGKAVDINDSFRLGKFTEGKIRPILVKLNTAWDRRLILDSSNKLKAYKGRIYINPDESMNERRKKALHWLSCRAEREGKAVFVGSGVILFINDISPDNVNDYFCKISTDDKYMSRVTSFRCNITSSSTNFEVYNIEFILRTLKKTSPGVDDIPS